MIEEAWNIAQHELLALEFYPSFEGFREKVSRYFRTKRFGPNMRNHLLKMV